MKKMVGLILTVIAVLSGCAQATGGDDGFTDETYFPDGWTFERPETMLVLGNSICQIPGEWGMSASSPEKDYVHLLAGKLGCTVTARNSWDYEQTYDTFDIYTFPDADMVVIQLGDNMEKRYAGYDKYLGALIDRYEGKTVILISTIIKNENLEPVDVEIQRAAIAHGVPYIDLRDILRNPVNVGGYAHPNDTGMALIANGIYSVIIQYEVEK